MQPRIQSAFWALSQLELADVIVKSLSIVFERSWRIGEVPEDWRKANVTSVFKKGKKEDPGNYRPANVTSVFKKGKKEDPGNYRPPSLTSIPGKVMEQLISILWMSSPSM
ncbi:rna-directed dna polymerase from mobile element hypothetical protein [Limosa lapponica baueri]|uniref:Rna-directed dna polymerase from mobile element jockey-like n=1 Tax=Limosa lapponica baueri TaxID=1758121 RepID=A0A2I0UAN3_LIMLA|nr:rna-directed dna polymerase from mobile element hypothetical protein [Limosa lapponica baueri]